MVVNPAAGLRAVTLDVGGTLISPWPSVGHVYAAAAARHGAGEFSADELNRRFAAAWRARPGFVHTRAAWAALVDETFQGLTAQAPSQTFFPDLYARFGEPAAWRLYDDTLPTLQALAARGVRMGVVSNWDERLHPLLEKLGLRGFFAAVVVSCDVGVTKPSAEIFARAARALDLPPATILHVGDSPEMDEAGARAAGFQAALLDRGAASAAAGRLRSLNELTERFPADPA
jgi:putative hydrolase of the HAD superfamily